MDNLPYVVATVCCILSAIYIKRLHDNEDSVLPGVILLFLSAFIPFHQFKGAQATSITMPSNRTNLFQPVAKI
jgi:hypothetical protein